MNVLGYSCLSACGNSPESLWKSLYEGKLNLATDGVFRIDGSKAPTSREKLGEQLLKVWADIQTQTASQLFGGTFGVILASTKGSLEDVIWDANSNAPKTDTIYPVLDYFLDRSKLNPALATCVSNACASSHGAIYLAKQWLDSGVVEKVLVLAVDEVGRFILNGFKSLGALSQTSARPFSQDRDGLSLGEAAAGILLSSDGKSDFEIDGIAIETEGHSITRPSTDGKRLELLVQNALNGQSVDAIVAHATATKFNDLTEDKVFSSLLKDTPITAVKWCIGHTLGTSGLMDTIAAFGILRFQRIFKIATTQTIDQSFQAKYCNQESTGSNGLLNRILITSLGFGGMQAAMCIHRRAE